MCVCVALFLVGFLRSAICVCVAGWLREVSDMCVCGCVGFQRSVICVCVAALAS